MAKFASNNFEYLGPREEISTNQIIISYMWHGQKHAEPFSEFINSYLINLLSASQLREIINANEKNKSSKKIYTLQQCLENPDIFTVVNKTTREERSMLAIDIFKDDFILENIDAVSLRRLSQYLIPAQFHEDIRANLHDDNSNIIKLKAQN